ncbi:nuclease-related domain-containing protein [Domibacillus sp. DTU_2020_1001157_1_SI_ALB_TIR_016]|uniref:nuclease-related domain-containing protein n=1 Tax=Domibacillus sp. DTU_2020_1001157_1_SI_ALB_TIR_016 TaxID=3077789 RepID=UPI0028EF5391|nr:nuclease-related domain-containing protein [Domibacillus sp. DTU_2020_1001157_1_SI_ALB_TIR_016]WNS81151.1 nuclease-related domain-containing protein [Domibacillus sp. DTU_2020_1001157_1_SI_ALB_TIR_016]
MDEIRIIVQPGTSPWLFFCGSARLGPENKNMDTVVITQQMIFILDAKHFSGRLVFDRLTRQLRRGNVTYDDPITQVLRHKRGLEQWLDQPIPIMAAVVLTHPNVRIEITPPDAFDHSLILYAQEISAKVHEFFRANKPF